jgi:hypothetical protein
MCMLPATIITTERVAPASSASERALPTVLVSGGSIWLLPVQTAARKLAP